MTSHTIEHRQIRITLIDAHPTPENLRAAVVAGMAREPRALPSKFFYDEAGARLFDRITTLDEYYPTRTELAILRRRMDAISELIGPRARVIEFGSGSGLKTRMLLQHLEQPASYVPVDISREQLVRFAVSIARACPGMTVQPVCADYTSDIPLPETPGAQRTVIFFPGSTIGNFEPDEAADFLRRARRLAGPGGGLLIGADLHKDPGILERAYNDAAGVTAMFNLNLLARINRETGADFDVTGFRHRAFYDPAEQRIEMQLVATRPMTVRVPGETDVAVFGLDMGEYIRTEYSHKYTPAGFAIMARSAGWKVQRFWTDERAWFGVWLLESAGA